MSQNKCKRIKNDIEKEIGLYFTRHFIRVRVRFELSSIPFFVVFALLFLVIDGSESVVHIQRLSP